MTRSDQTQPKQAGADPTATTPPSEPPAAGDVAPTAEQRGGAAAGTGPTAAGARAVPAGAGPTGDTPTAELKVQPAPAGAPERSGKGNGKGKGNGNGAPKQGSPASPPAPKDTPRGGVFQRQPPPATPSRSGAGAPPAPASQAPQAPARTQATPAQAEPVRTVAPQVPPAASRPVRPSPPPAGPRGTAPAGSSPGGPPPWERGKDVGARSAPPEDADRSANPGDADGARSNGARGPAGPAVVEASTSHIRREDTPQDMPDLSEARRPVADRGRPAAENAVAARLRAERSESEPTAARPSSSRSSSSGRAPRRAALQIKRLDPWSVLKLALVLSVVLFLVWMIAVGVLYLVLDGMGVWERINTTFNDFVTVSDPNGGGEGLIDASSVFGVAAIIGAVNVLLFTAIATLSSFVYNLSSDLAGGVEVTFTERD